MGSSPDTSRPGVVAPAPAEVTLGILAGGAATRLGGADKAWLRRGGLAQVVRRQQEVGRAVGRVLVSANRSLDRYAGIGLETVADLQTDRCGPLGGLEALAMACTTPWLLTVPVDLLELPAGAVERLYQAARGNGCFAQDDTGPQPLVALWRTAALRDAARLALAQGRHGVHALQLGIGLEPVPFSGVCFGNLNVPADLERAGIEPDSAASTEFPASS